MKRMRFRGLSNITCIVNFQTDMPDPKTYKCSHFVLFPPLIAHIRVHITFSSIVWTPEKPVIYFTCFLPSAVSVLYKKLRERERENERRSSMNTGKRLNGCPLPGPLYPTPQIIPPHYWLLQWLATKLTILAAVASESLYSTYLIGMARK